MTARNRSISKTSVVCAALALATVPEAQALVFTWSHGEYLAQGLPDPLDSLSVINAVAGGSKSIAGSVVSDGRINWLSSDLLTLSSVTTVLRNNGLFDQQADGRINGPRQAIFDNAGTLVKSGGSGDLLINVTLINRSGATLDAGSGRIVYDNTSTFEAGTAFKGAGTHVFGATGLTGPITFGGDFSGQNNLLFNYGRFTAAAPTTPQTDATYSGGIFAGPWSVESGRKLVAITGGAKSIDGSFVNNGHIAWVTSDLLTLGSVTTVLRNNGSFDQQVDGRINGPRQALFDNAGTLRKTGGAGDLFITAGIVNTGAIESLSGNIVLPDKWHNDGTLRGTAAFQTDLLTNAGDIAPGLPDPAQAIATLTLTGDLTETTTATLSFDLGAAGISDVLDVSGAVVLDGTVRVSRHGSYIPQLGDSFRVMNFASFSGAVQDVLAFGFGSGVQFDAVYAPTYLELRVAAVPEPGTWGTMLCGLGVMLLVAVRKTRGVSRPAPAPGSCA